MTREEKIICKHFLNDADKTHSCNEYKLLMALLEQEPTTKNDLGVDCISREQAKAAIREKFKDLPSRVEINAILNDLPSVTPQEPKTGHWIDDTKYGGTECSECGKWYPHATIAKSEIKYCSECGAKMVEP